MNKWQAILSSPHTTIPGVLIAACAIGAIWIPSHKDQFHQTIEFLTAYMGIMASQINGHSTTTVTTPTNEKTSTTNTTGDAAKP